MSTNDRRSYSAGHFGMQIDGEKVSAFIKAVEGGFIKANPIDEAIGGDVYHAKHLSTREIEPFSVEIGLSGCKSVLSWISESWNKKFSRRHGQIAHADFNKYGKFEHDFTDALIMETGFPALDKMAREPGYLKIKFQPEAVKTKQVNSSRILAEHHPQQKKWHNAAFRVHLAGIDVSMVSKIDAFTIKQGVKMMHTGRMRLPEIEPTKIEFPDLSIHVSAEYAKEFMDWHQRVVLDGGRDTAEEKTGAIEFLAPDRDEVIFTVKLFEVGIKGFAITRSEAMQEAIKRAKVDLYVGRMELEPGPGLA